LQQKSNKKVIKKFAMIDKDNELWENMNKGGMTFSRTNWPKQPLFNAEFFDAVSYAKNFKPRTDYWHSLWHEGEMAFLFADTNLGKSILAVQIANEVANKIQRNVLYFDFEHSPQQLRQRYTDESGLQWNCSHFLRRVDVRMAYSNDYHIPSLLDAIERNVVDSKAAAIVIDNISAIITDPCDRRFVRDFLKSLNVIRERYDLAVLVIGHTRRHSRYEPLSVNNAACATTISDLCDSVFAIGQSTTDPALRYIKQLKNRSGEITYDALHVIPAVIVRQNHGLFFEMHEVTQESRLIDRISAERWRQYLSARILQQKGCSIRQIAATIGLSKSSVQRLLNRYEVVTDPLPEEDLEKGPQSQSKQSESESEQSAKSSEEAPEESAAKESQAESEELKESADKKSIVNSQRENKKRKKHHRR
jgi:KaiC/GvpD/RAD55 family RecA-like ATPase